MSALPDRRAWLETRAAAVRAVLRHPCPRCRAAVDRRCAEADDLPLGMCTERVVAALLADAEHAALRAEVAAEIHEAAGR